MEKQGDAAGSSLNPAVAGDGWFLMSWMKLVGDNGERL